MKILYICISIFVLYLGVQESPCPGYGYCCQSVVCPKDTVIDNLQECMESTGRPVCVCNRKDWFYGQDPFRCNLANSSLKLSAMEKEVELTQDGTVRPCPPGYFKSQYGGSICSPHSNVSTTPATSSSTKADTNSTAAKIDIWIGLLIAAVVMIICIIAFAFWLKRRRASSKKEKKDNPLPAPRQVMTTQGQDYRGGTEGSLPATDYDGKKDDLKRCLLNKRKADNSSEAIKSQESLDYAEDSLPDEVGSPMEFGSLFEDSEDTCREEDGSDFQKVHVAQENSYENHSMDTSRDLGIGLSADFKDPETWPETG